MLLVQGPHFKEQGSRTALFNRNVAIRTYVLVRLLVVAFKLMGTDTTRDLHQKAEKRCQ